jgi:hypothetical protein
MSENSTLSELFPLPEEAKKLKIFLGDWMVEGKLTMEGKPFNAKGTWKFEPAAAGWAVLAKMKMNIEGMGNYEEVDIAGYDPGQDLFHIFSVTNTAAAHDHKGKWSDDKTLKVVYEGMQEGKKQREEITIKFNNPKQWSIHEVDTLNGQIISTMDVTLRK